MTPKATGWGELPLVGRQARGDDLGTPREPGRKVVARSTRTWVVYQPENQVLLLLTVLPHFLGK